MFEISLLSYFWLKMEERMVDPYRKLASFFS